MGNRPLLADYMVNRQADETLEDYLDNRVFAGMSKKTVQPDPTDENGFTAYMDRFVSCIPVLQAAVEHFRS